MSTRIFKSGYSNIQKKKIIETLIASQKCSMNKFE